MRIGDPEERARLKELAEKIKALLHEYDVAALINLQGKHQAEFVTELTPTWSCFVWENDASDGHLVLRFRAKLKTGDDDERERACHTVGMVLGMLKVKEKQREQLMIVLRMLGQHMGIESVIKEQDEESTDGNDKGSER